MCFGKKLVMALIGVIFSSTATAATPVSPREEDQRLPETYAAPENPSYQKPQKPDFELPVVPEPGSTAPLSKSPRILVTKYRFTGNTVFTDQQLEAITEPYTNRYLSIEALQALRQRITLKYVRAGYVNSGALLPDQSVENGTIRYEIIEGRLDNLQITGLTRLNERYVRGRLERFVQTPLNTNTLQNGLLLFQQNPLIETIKAQMRPGAQPGHADLTVDIAEAKPYEISLVADNHRSPSVGSEQGTLGLVYRNLTGFGDTASASYSLTSGVKQYWASYALPVNRYDTSVRVYYINGESQVISTSFKAIDIENDSNSTGAEVTQPVYRRTDGEWVVGARIERKKTTTSLLNQPFSFTPGVINGKSKVTHFDLFQRWRYRDNTQALFTQLTAIFGTDWLGATKNDNLPDSQYFALRAQAQWARALGARGQLVSRADLTWTDDHLLSSEKTVIGGFYSVRGYREGILVGDRAAVGSLEYRHRLGFAFRPKHQFQAAVFADGGWVDTTGPSLPTPNSIGSVGVGALYRYGKHFHATVYLAKTLRHIAVADKGLVDRGVSLEAGLRY